MLGGHADGVRGPILSFLVQSLRRAELQEDALRACHCSAGGDHQGGRHRDTNRLDMSALREDIFFSDRQHFSTSK